MSLPSTPHQAPVATPPAPVAGEPAPRPRLGYRPELDGLRGVAVLLVVAYHTGALMWPSAGSWWPRGGALGVDLFFVLSGFLITSLLVDEHRRRGRVDVLAFARRRVLRLVPAMAALFAVVLVVAALGHGHHAVDEVASTAGWSLTFTTNWAVLDGRPVMMGHLWSVAIEGQFYLLWATAVVVSLRARRSLGPLAAVAVLAVAGVVWWRSAQAGDGSDVGQLYRLYLGTTSRLDAPLVGALAGLAYAAGRFDRLRGRGAVAAAVAGLGGLLVAAATVGPVEPELYRGLYTLVALACAAAVVGAVRAGDGTFGRVLAARPLVLAGVVSYSLYLWHLPIFEWIADSTPGWPSPARSAAGIAASLAAAAVSYRVVERPFLRRRHRTASAADVGRDDQRSVASAKQRSSRSPNAYSS